MEIIYVSQTSHIDVLTVDKRALYIMAVEVASAIDGYISEDDKETWVDVETFKELHKDVLSLTYDEAVEISLEELKTMVPVRDPLWEEEELLAKSTSKSMVNEFMTTRKTSEIIYKGDFTKEIPFDYLELAKRMWFGY